MQKHYFGVAAAAAMVSAFALLAPAKAADLGKYHESMKDAPVYVAPTTWSGFYVGGHIGAAWTSGSASLDSEHCRKNKYRPALDSEVALASIAVPSYTCVESSNYVDLGDTSVIGGVHVGFNIQKGSIVYGLEGDVSFADNIDYLASVRGRLGVAAGNLLFYGTGGVAFISGGYSGTISDANVVNVAYDTTEDNVGFVVGGGAEMKLAPNWSIGVEGLYYGFDEKNYHAEDSFGTKCNYVNYSVDANGIADVGVVRARLSYHVGRDYEALK